MAIGAPVTYADKRWFYVLMAYACALVAFIGFTPTYWAPVVTGSFSGPPILHLHGLLFSTWMLFFITQTTLAAIGRVEHHRALGLFGIALAPAMLIVGIIAQLHSLKVGIADGLEVENRTFSIVPISIVIFFSCAVAVAIANIPRPETHKRLMLVATISILPPAIARLIAVMASLPIAPGHPPPIAFSLIPSFLSDLLLIGAIFFDWNTRGRPHPTYLIAGGALVVLQVVRVPLGATPAWHAVTSWLQSFAS
jgi:hypothetical protein